VRYYHAVRGIGRLAQAFGGMLAIIRHSHCSGSTLLIKAVVFDMDGVLCHYRIERRLALLASWSGRSPDAIHAAIWRSGFEDEAERGVISADDYLKGFGERIGYPLSAAQWVEVPDLSRAALALSSIVVLAEGEDGGAAPPNARGTLSFDRARRAEVSRRFSRDGHLDYLLVVYGRRKPGTASPLEVDVETQLLSGNSILTRSPRHPVSAEGPAGLPVVTGRLRLDPLAPGDYELRLVVSNRSASASATRSLRFTIE